MAPLHDESDTIWENNDYWEKQAYRFIALADIVGMRRLQDGVGLLLERASFGDPGEIMRGLRHSCEAAFNPDWDDLARVYILLANSPRTGTRLWALDQLTILDDPNADSVFRHALSDTTQCIREVAERGLKRLEKRRTST